MVSVTFVSGFNWSKTLVFLRVFSILLLFKIRIPLSRMIRNIPIKHPTGALLFFFAVRFVATSV